MYSHPMNLLLLKTLVIAAGLTGLVGCAGKPSAANTELRKKIQTLEAEIVTLKAGRGSDSLTIAQLRKAQGGTSVATLTEERLGEIVSAYSIKLQSRSIFAEPEGLTVLFSPVDMAGDEVKSAGEVTVQVFDLSQKQNLLGTWTLTRDQLSKTWVSGFFLEGYMLKLDWQTRPTSEKLVVRVSFIDRLTGRVLETQGEVRMKNPAS